MFLSQNELIKLAHENPEELIRLIKSDELDIPCLTYAAEYLGAEAQAGEEVVYTLLFLTYNQSPLVREGAIYGLYDYVEGEEGWNSVVRIRLDDMANTDPSRGVAEAAMDALS
jgi:hypothetical protein